MVMYLQDVGAAVRDLPLGRAPTVERGERVRHSPHIASPGSAAGSGPDGAKQHHAAGRQECDSERAHSRCVAQRIVRTVYDRVLCAASELMVCLLCGGAGSAITLFLLRGGEALV